MFALALYRIKCPRCFSENLDNISIGKATRYQCKECQKKFFRLMHELFFIANIGFLFLMFLYIYEIYNVGWLQNHMLLSNGIIAGIFNGWWIKYNFSTIKKYLQDYRCYIRKLSILPFFLLNIMLPASMHLINEHFGVTESTIVYGELTDVREIKKRRRRGAYTQGTFYIDTNVHKGFVYKSVSGYKDMYSLVIRVVVKKGFFGWEWVQDQAIVEIE